jgi:hypothetical protein
MLAFMMIVVWIWSCDERADSFGGWLEAARRSRFEDLVAGQSAGVAAGAPGGDQQPEPGAAPEAAVTGHGGIDDDEHLAAYNAYLAQLNRSAPEAGRPKR